MSDAEIRSSTMQERSGDQSGGDIHSMFIGFTSRYIRQSLLEVLTQFSLI